LNNKAKKGFAANKSSAANGSVGQLVGQAIDGISRTQGTALDKVPSEHAGILQIALIVALVCGVLGGLLIHTGQPLFGFGALAIAAIALVVAMYFLRPASHRAVNSVNLPSAGSSVPPQWSRVMLRTIPLAELRKLSEKLRVIRANAQKIYVDLLSVRVPKETIDVTCLRINVFVPDIEHAQYGEVCRLFIPEELQHGMDRPEECAITFRPNEGLTGRVFSIGEPLGARRRSDDSPWERVHVRGAGEAGKGGLPLTVAQSSAVNDGLRWIISFPLQMHSPDGIQTFAVLNVDGSGHDLNVDEMQRMYQALHDSVDELAKEMSIGKKFRARVIVEDV
jgi:hypothetical protein